METGEIEKKLENISEDLRMLKNLLLRFDWEGKEYYQERDIEELKLEYDEKFFPLPFNEKVKVEVSIEDFLEKSLNEKLLTIWNDQVRYNTDEIGGFAGLTERLKGLKLHTSISLVLVFLIFLKLFF